MRGREFQIPVLLMLPQRGPTRLATLPLADLAELNGVARGRIVAVSDPNKVPEEGTRPLLFGQLQAC